MNNNDWQKDGDLEDAFTKYTCFICEERYPMGPHQYDIKLNKLYEFSTCLTCLSNNHDGWAPLYEEKILQYLKDNNIPTPERNEKGWLPVE